MDDSKVSHGVERVGKKARVGHQEMKEVIGSPAEEEAVAKDSLRQLLDKSTPTDEERAQQKSVSEELEEQKGADRASSKPSTRELLDTLGYQEWNDEEGLDKAHHSFPERLMELLEGEIATDAMWWLPGNDAFAIVPKIFPDAVLDKYFQGTKFESFTRKLNRCHGHLIKPQLSLDAWCSGDSSA
jgi:HSF-type DNA-binding